MSLISVIMPYRQKKEYVHKAIKSVMGQTYKKFELIIIKYEPIPYRKINNQKQFNIIKEYSFSLGNIFICQPLSSKPKIEHIIPLYSPVAINRSQHSVVQQNFSVLQNTTYYISLLAHKQSFSFWSELHQHIVFRVTHFEENIKFS